MLSSLILVSRQLLARIRNLEKRKGIPKAELIIVIGLTLFLSLWLPWNIDTNPMGSEAETYNTQAKCIEIRLAGDNRDGGFCDFLFFGSRHELIYSILILFTRKILHSGIFTMRILVNILNILTAIIIYLLLRKLNSTHLSSILAVLLYFLIPYKLEFINEPGAENLLFLFVFGLIYYIVASKEKKFSVTFLVLCWLLIFTRIEFVFILPVFVAWYLSKNRIKIDKIGYLKILLMSLPLILVLYEFSKTRTCGLVSSGFSPLLTMSGLIFIFVINRIYKNKDFLREFVESSILIIASLYLAFKAPADSYFTISSYLNRVLKIWIPATHLAIKEGHLAINIFLFLSLVATVIYLIKTQKKGYKNILALVFIALQIFLTRTFLQPLFLNTRTLSVVLTFFLLPLILIQGLVFSIDKDDLGIKKQRNRVKKWLVISAYIILVCLSIVGLLKTNFNRGTIYKFYDAIDNCQEHESILFLTGEMNLPLIYSSNNIVPISHMMEEIDKKYDKIILNHSNICWIDYKDSDNEGEEFNRLLNKIREILKKDYDVKGKYENSLLITYSLQKKPT